ncbi:hypothetical protein AHAS_Ahas04G0101100 [Arachis hypogaea]
MEEIFTNAIDALEDRGELMVRDDRSHKDIWKDYFDPQVINTVKDIVIDDVKYKFQGMVNSDPHEIKDIVVNEKRVEGAQWVYAEVGKELRLCSRDSLYLGSTNVATCNELNTYLHLVDGFVSSPQRNFPTVTAATTTIDWWC